jgi:hypothetical protein
MNVYSSLVSLAVQQRSPVQVLQVLRAQSQRAADLHRQIMHPLAVSARVGILCLDRLHQRQGQLLGEPRARAEHQHLVDHRGHLVRQHLAQVLVAVGERGFVHVVEQHHEGVDAAPDADRTGQHPIGHVGENIGPARVVRLVHDERLARGLDEAEQVAAHLDQHQVEVVDLFG